MICLKQLVFNNFIDFLVKDIKVPESDCISRGKVAEYPDIVFYNPCWGEEDGLPHLAHRLAGRLRSAPKGSYTRRLLEDPRLLEEKLVEEARELARARGARDVAWETADLLYFTLVAMVRSGVELSEVEEVLDRRALKVTRRPGDAKPKGRR